MRKAIVIILLAVLSLSFSVALATDGVIYRDDNLGFSFEIPSDFEYVGDMLEESIKEVENMESDEIDETMKQMEENEQFYSKQPTYLGESSILSIAYINSAKLFEKLESALPNGTTSDEMDFYLMGSKERKSNLEIASDELKSMNFPQFSEISNEMIDYGGKLCVTTKSKYFLTEVNADTYQYSVMFIYKKYSIGIAHVKLDYYGEFSEETAFAEFDGILSTLKFDTIPQDKEARLETGIDWTRIAIWGVSGALIGVAIAVIKKVLIKRKIKKLTHENDSEDKGDDDES